MGVVSSSVPYTLQLLGMCPPPLKRSQAPVAESYWFSLVASGDAMWSGMGRVLHKRLQATSSQAEF